MHYAEVPGNGHVDVVKLLLDRGANVHAADNAALRWSCMRGRLKVVQLLLAHGACVGAKDDDAFRKCAAYGRIDIAKLLLANGANICAGALHQSAGNGHTNMVELLLDRGADINSRLRISSVSVLRAGASRGHIDVVKLLIRRGVNVLAENENYPIQLVRCITERGYVEVMTLLLEHGINVDFTDAEQSAAKYSINRLLINGHIPVLKILFDYGFYCAFKKCMLSPAKERLLSLYHPTANWLNAENKHYVQMIGMLGLLPRRKLEKREAPLLLSLTQQCRRFILSHRLGRQLAALEEVELPVLLQYLRDAAPFDFLVQNNLPII
jgi:hypothetical protein